MKSSLSYFTIEPSIGPQSRLLSAPHLPTRGRGPGTGWCILQFCPRDSAESCHHHLSNRPGHLACTVSLHIYSSSRCGYSYYPHLQGGSEAQRDGASCLRSHAAHTWQSPDLNPELLLWKQWPGAGAAHDGPDALGHLGWWRPQVFLILPNKLRPPGTWGTSFLMPQTWFLEPLSRFPPAWPLWAATRQVGRRTLSLTVAR